jgi:hypothetical protein
MISINKEKMTIEFTPRSGFNTKPLTKKLIFAHICPSCNNVIQAFFETTEAVNLWSYEETRQMSIDVDNIKPIELKAIVPGPKDVVGRTQYHSNYDGKTHSQKITMKNHILKHSIVNVNGGDEKADWETGGKMCEWAGLFSLREDLLLRDYILFSRINLGKLYKYNPKKVEEVKFNTPGMKVCGFPVEAIGEAPPVILIRYNIVNRGWENAVGTFMEGL